MGQLFQVVRRILAYVDDQGLPCDGEVMSCDAALINALGVHVFIDLKQVVEELLAAEPAKRAARLAEAEAKKEKARMRKEKRERKARGEVPEKPKKGKAKKRKRKEGEGADGASAKKPKNFPVFSIGPALARVIGSEERTRQQVVKDLWCVVGGRGRAKGWTVCWWDESRWVIVGRSRCDFSCPLSSFPPFLLSSLTP
jgi:hypothetical protein